MNYQQIAHQARLAALLREREMEEQPDAPKYRQPEHDPDEHKLLPEKPIVSPYRRMHRFDPRNQGWTA